MQKLRSGTLITSEMLRELGACKPHIKDFEDEWPKGVTFRLKNLKRADELDFDIETFIDYAHEAGMISDIRYGFIQGYIYRFWENAREGLITSVEPPFLDLSGDELDAEYFKTYIRIVWKELG